jgi:N-methylhydantoinase A/oxoprolinase/acetone carboxylase beta subunit
MSNRIGIDVGGTTIDTIALSPYGAALFEKRSATPNTYDGLIVARLWG